MMLGLVPARGGSKGVPRKNLREVGGKPLVGRAIEVGRQCADLHRVIVSTDDNEIREVALAFGAEVPFLRPAELATDTAGMLPVMQHAVRFIEEETKAHVEALVLLDPTAPLRTRADVEGAIRLFRESDCDAVISGHAAHRNPYFNMVMSDPTTGGPYVKLVCESDPPVVRRQDAPAVFDLNTVVWIFSRRALLEEQSRIPKKSVLYEVPVERAADIDSELDLELLEQRWKRFGGL